MADSVGELKVVITAEDNASAVISGIAGEMSALERAQGGTGAALARTAGQVQSSWQKTGKGMKEFAEGVDAVAKPLYVMSAATAAAGGAAAKFAIDFEDNFAAVKKTVEETDTTKYEDIKQAIIDMTTVGRGGRNAIPQTTAQLTELAAAGGQLGIATDNIVDFTETMAMLGASTNLIGSEGAATLARFMNVTNTSQDKISNLGSAIVELGNNFASTEAEIAQMALNMGATGSVIGISAQDVLAYSTALSSLGVEAQAGGSAVSRIWMDIQSAVSSGGEDLTKFAKISGKSSKDFAEQWKTDASGAFQDFLKGLSRSEDQIGTLADLGFNNIRDIQALQRLAGDKGLELLTNAIKRSNEAWEQNVALQNEFDAKAETTASKIQVAKNNATEAARSLGEVLLPSIIDITGSLSSAAQGMAKMDDGTKKMIVNAGLATVALGATTKAVTGGIKTVGSVIEGVGKIKGLFAAGGALANAGPSLAAIGPAAGVAVAGIAAVSAAVLIGKASYDNWYDSQYRWSQGLSDGNERIKESLNQYKQLSLAQQEIKNLKLIIENPDSSAEEVEQAKARLEEIKSLLSEEYNLVINSDNSDLDETIEKIKQVSANELQSNINRQNQKLSELRNKNENYETDRAEAERNYNQALDMQTKASNAKMEIEKINDQVKAHTLDQAEGYKKAQEIYEQAMGRAYHVSSTSTDNIDGLLYGVGGIKAQFDEASRQVKYFSDAIKNLDGSHAEMVAVGTELANWQTELVGLNAQAKDSEGVRQALEGMGETIRLAGLDMNGYAQAAALAMNGVDKLETAWEQAANGDGQALNGIVNDYITAMTTFGASTEEAVKGAALLKEGFRDVSEVGTESVPAVMASIRELGNAQGLDMTAEKLTEMAQSMGLLPDNKHIEISADGDISIVEKTKEEVEELPDEHNTEINAEDNASDKAENATNSINEVPKTHDTDINADDNTAAGVASAKANLDSIPRTITVSIEVQGAAVPSKLQGSNFSKFSNTGSFKVKHGATGFDNFSGGLAMVNDQKGIPDPREMIVDKGRAFIPEGRNVILPLSKGAKVYTAAQTQAIMRGMGIPHYAKGKDNSEQFTNARDDWQHYTKTHAVTTTEELEKYLEFQEKFKDNEKDIWDIEEQLFSLRQKLMNEDMQKTRDMLAHNEKYNGASVNEYLAGIDEMRAKNEQYYNEGLKSHEEYIKDKIKLDEEYFDKHAELYDQMLDVSLAYADDRTYFNDWQDNGDDPISAFNRVRDRELGAIGDGRTAEEAQKNIADYGSALFQGRIKQSKAWLEEQRKYFNLSDADYAAGIQRMKDYTQEYLKEGLIGAREAHEAMTELRHMELDEAASAYDTMLQNQQTYISEMREKFQKQEQDLRNSWTVDDRRTSIAELSENVRLWSGAVTERGKEQLKQYEEQLKQAQREEELYKIQQSNNAIIDGLEKDYKKLEADKKKVLAQIASTEVNISGIVDSFTSTLEGQGASVVNLLSTLIKTVENKEIKGGDTYKDDRKVTNNTTTNIYPSVGSIAYGTWNVYR